MERAEEYIMLLGMIELSTAGSTGHFVRCARRDLASIEEISSYLKITDYFFP